MFHRRGDYAGALPTAPEFRSKLNISEKTKVRPVSGRSQSCMRLLSFLSDIERAVLAESPVVDGGAWESTRMVNFHHNLARLSLKPRNTEEVPFPAGAIFLQAFALADGSLCLKASLNWVGSESFPVMSVYSTPQTNWKLEASRIASAWLEGPTVVVVSSAESEGASAFTAIAS